MQTVTPLPFDAPTPGTTFPAVDQQELASMLDIQDAAAVELVARRETGRRIDALRADLSAFAEIVRSRLSAH